MIQTDVKFKKDIGNMHKWKIPRIVYVRREDIKNIDSRINEASYR